MDRCGKLSCSNDAKYPMPLFLYLGKEKKPIKVGYYFICENCKQDHDRLYASLFKQNDLPVLESVAVLQDSLL